MSLLHTLLLAAHGMALVALSIRMRASSDTMLARVPDHLTWWVGCRFGHARQPVASRKP